MGLRRFPRSIAEHARKFSDPSLPVLMNRQNFDIGLALILTFLHHEMRLRQRSDLWKVSYTDNLMMLTEFRHPQTDDPADFPSDVGIDFIENQNRRPVDPRQNRFKREHHPGDFPARCDFIERSKFLSGIR